MLFVGDTDNGNTENTPDYCRTVYLDVKNIDKNDKNTWTTIYAAIYAPYFGEVKLFPKEFLDQFKKDPNDPQKFHLKSRRI